MAVINQSYYPLELNKSLLKKFNLTEPEDKYIDITQISNYLLGNYDLNFLYHDNATKLFTSIFNNEKYQIFEILVQNLLGEFIYHKLPLDFYHIRNKKNEDSYDFKYFYTTNTGIKLNTDTFYKIYEEKINKKIIQKTNPPPFSFTKDVCVLALFEFDEDDFGHYGAMFFNGVDTIHIFDSMMRSTNNRVNTSSYNFRDIFINNLFNTTGLNFVNDLYTDESKNIYSLEITGGSYNVKNPLISTHIYHRENSFKQYILGVDNQNQFCYMWALLYIIVNGVNIIKEKKNQQNQQNGKPPLNIVSFIDLHDFIIKNTIIPVVAIKTFILLLLQYYTPNIDKVRYKQASNLLIEEPFFIQNFNKIVTNNINYNLVFADNISEFKSYMFGTNKIYTTTDFLEDICDYFYNELSNLIYNEVPVAKNNDIQIHIETYINSYLTAFGKNLLDDLSKKGNFNAYTYMNLIFENYNDLNISINKQPFIVITKKPKKVGRRTPQPGGANKITYYKFINKINKIN
jgi:hypothetical protein